MREFSQFVPASDVDWSRFEEIVIAGTAQLIAGHRTPAERLTCSQCRHASVTSCYHSDHSASAATEVIDENSRSYRQTITSISCRSLTDPRDKNRAAVDEA